MIYIQNCLKFISLIIWINLTLSCSKVWIESTPSLIESTPAHQGNIWHTSAKMARMNSTWVDPSESWVDPIFKLQENKSLESLRGSTQMELESAQPWVDPNRTWVDPKAMSFKNQFSGISERVDPSKIWVDPTEPWVDPKSVESTQVKEGWNTRFCGFWDGRPQCCMSRPKWKLGRPQ